MESIAVLELVNKNGHTGLKIKGNGADLMNLIAIAAAELEYSQEPENRTEFRTMLIEQMDLAKKLKMQEEFNENFKY